MDVLSVDNIGFGTPSSAASGGSGGMSYDDLYQSLYQYLYSSYVYSAYSDDSSYYGYASGYYSYSYDYGPDPTSQPFVSTSLTLAGVNPQSYPGECEPLQWIQQRAPHSERNTAPRVQGAWVDLSARRWPEQVPVGHVGAHDGRPRCRPGPGLN